MRTIYTPLAPRFQLDKLRDLGGVLFAHTRRLRTCVISHRQNAEHGPAYVDDRELQLGLVHEWERLCPDLNSIGFTPKVTWEKCSEDRKGGGKEWVCRSAVAE